MKELIHIEDHRACLHCDNGECGYIMPEGSVTWGPHLIGYPCPKCASNMLTAEDYATSDKMHRAFQWINKWFGWMGSEYSPDDPKWNARLAIRHRAGETIIRDESK